MAAKPLTKKALIVVRTYPTPAKTGVEVSCTAAISDKGEWLRLFPIPYRFLEPDRRFAKYQWVQVLVEKAKDDRPESYKLLQNSIKILSEPLSTTDCWRARKAIVFPLRQHCLCCLKAALDHDGHPTLGVFKPHRIERLQIAPESPKWSAAQLAILRQGHLFEKGPKKELEKVPHKFSYKFSCDHSACSGHTLMCADWEMGESWRKWKGTYGDGWEAKFRERYELEMIHSKDTHFFVGTIRKHPMSWIIVGLFYPPPQPQGSFAFN
jgi:hypothetical protein